MNFLSNLRIKTKILLIILFAICGNLFIVYTNAKSTEHLLKQERTLKTRHLTETAYSLINNTYEDFKKGLMTEDQAKARALNTLKTLRYESKDYFWVNTPEPRVIMHPMIPEIENQDLATQNPKLFKLFGEMSVAAKSTSAGGSYHYLWSKPGEDKTALFPKVSYVKYFGPWNWVVGTGIYIDDIQAAYYRNLSEGLINTVIIMAIVLLISLLISNDLTRPMHKVNSNLQELAAGNTNIESVYQNRRDEIGDIARAFDVFKRNTLEKNQLELEQKETEKRQAAERKKVMLEMADAFDSQVGHIVHMVGSAASDLQNMANDLSATIQKTTQQSQQVAESSQQASANVSTVASATEELSASIQDISANILTTSRSAQDCAREALLSQEKLDLLQQAVQEIETVVQTISKVAEQTNLLALNATIEASRAGESGKGFSVVANEVKTLAGQTRTMTNDISQKVAHIRNSAQETVETVNAIIHGVNEVDERTTRIASAVEEQTVATQEISRNVQRASESTNNVSSSIDEVKVATEHSERSTVRLKESSDSLANQAEALKESVQKFLHQIRNS